MEKQDIENCLSLLGKWLEEMKVSTTFRLLMIGGGFMLTQVGSRNFTKDVDVLMYDLEDLYTTHDYALFKAAVRFVADDTGVDDSWLSDNISDFLVIAGPIPKRKLWRKFGRRLQVYVPPRDYILAHKLVVGREKDEDDIRALLGRLRIRTREKALEVVDKYITNQDIKEGEDSELYKMLNRFFPTS